MSYLGLNTTTDDHAAKASPADVRRKNRQLIFRLLFPTNQYSRAELGHISIDLDGPPCPCGKHGCLETMISGTALKKQLSAADVEQHQNILARAGRYLGQALAMPVGLLDMADVCVYGQPNIINATFIGAAQQYLDAATSSSFHKHTVIRRCECGPDITVQGEAIAVVFQHLAK